MRSLLAVSIVLWLCCGRAHAEGPACAIDDPTCACAEDDSCWALERIYSGSEALLGLRAALSAVPFASSSVDASALTVYSTERYVTVNDVTGHVAISGEIGGGTASTDGALGGELGFGLRHAASSHSGPFLRVGVSGQMLGNDAFALSSFEPIQLKTGFQVLEASLLIEGGLTTGFVAAGRFVTPYGEGENLGRSAKVGSFLVAWVGFMRFATSFAYLPAGLTPEGATLGVTRLNLCGHAAGVAICSDLLYAHGGEQALRAGGGRKSVLRLGLTVGLTP